MRLLGVEKEENRHLKYYITVNWLGIALIGKELGKIVTGVIIITVGKMASMKSELVYEFIEIFGVD